MSKADEEYQKISKSLESEHEEFDENGDIDDEDLDKNFDVADPEPEHSATVDLQGPIARDSYKQDEIVDKNEMFSYDGKKREGVYDVNKERKGSNETTANEDFWEDFASDDDDDEDDYEFQTDNFHVSKQQALDYIKSQGANGAHNDDMLENYNSGFDRNKISHMGTIEGLGELQDSGVIERRGDRWYSTESKASEMTYQEISDFMESDAGMDTNGATFEEWRDAVIRAGVSGTHEDFVRYWNEWGYMDRSAPDSSMTEDEYQASLLHPCQDLLGCDT